MSKLLVILTFLLVIIFTTYAQNAEHRDYCRAIRSCDQCVKATVPANLTTDEGGRCYWCKKIENGTTDVCLAYGFDLPIKATGECPNLNYNIDNCTVTALVYVILICIFVVIVFTVCTVVCCCCCCFCARKRQRQRELEDEHYMQEKDSIRKKSAERRAERKAKNDEIRKKYGLNEDTAGTYKRLE